MTGQRTSHGGLRTRHGGIHTGVDLWGGVPLYYILAQRALEVRRVPFGTETDDLAGEEEVTHSPPPNPRLDL